LHVQNFVDAVRKRDASMLNAKIEMGHHSTGWANLANIAFHAGKAYNHDQLAAVDSLQQWPLMMKQMQQQLQLFDIGTEQLVSSPVLNHNPESEQFVGQHAELANRFLKRTYRDNYAVPQID